MILNYFIPKADFPFNFNFYSYFNMLYFMKKIIETTTKILKLRALIIILARARRDKLLGRNMFFF